MGNSSPHANIGLYTYDIDPNGANAVQRACRHVWGRFRQTARMTLEYYIAHKQRWYVGHHMTILGQRKQSLVDSLFGTNLGSLPPEAHEQKNVHVDNLRDRLTLGSGFEADRLNLDEKYAADIKLYEDSVYEQVRQIRFRVYLPTTNTAVGDRQTYLMKEHILQNESKPGYCLATANRTNWPKGKTPDFSGITNELFTEMTGFGVEGVQISQLSHVESAVQVTTCKGKVYKPQLVVLDQRFQTVRLPGWASRNKNNKQLCYLVVYNAHFYLCKDHNMARDNV